MEMTEWLRMMQEAQKHQDLSDNWEACALGERMKMEGHDLKNLKEI